MSSNIQLRLPALNYCINKSRYNWYML